MDNKIFLENKSASDIENILEKTDCIIKAKSKSPIRYECKRSYGLNRETIHVEYNVNSGELTLLTEYESTYGELYNSFQNIDNPDFIHATPFFSSHKINLLNKGAITLVGLAGIATLIAFTPGAWKGYKQSQEQSSRIAAKPYSSSAEEHSSNKVKSQLERTYNTKKEGIQIAQSECEDYSLTVGSLLGYCVEGLYSHKDYSAIRTLMMNNQYGLAKRLEGNSCKAIVQVKGLYKGSSYQNTVNCDISYYVKHSR